MNQTHRVTGNLHSVDDEEFVTDFSEELETPFETSVKKVPLSTASCLRRVQSARNSPVLLD